MDSKIKEALEQWSEADELTSDWRKHAEEDIAFAAGDQWPAETKSRRERDHLPCLTIDRLEGPISQLIGDQRQNDIFVKVVCTSTNADKMRTDDGTEIDEHEFVSGLVRDIQRKSRFEWTQAQAFEQAVISGMGGWYMDTEYVSSSSFDQRIVIRPIESPISIYPDLRNMGSTEGQHYAFITEDIPESTFKAKWPKARGEWSEGPWKMDKAVRVATWWERSETADTLLDILASDGQRMHILASQLKDGEGLLPEGVQVLRERKVMQPKIMRRIITQGDILEESEWPGTLVPVAIVLGKRIWSRGRLDLQGLVRKARDAQIMYNYQRSATAETMGLAPKAPYVMTPEQIRGHENQWAMANHGTSPYLLVNPDPAAPGWPHRNQISYPQGFANEAIIAANDVMSITKIHEASLGQRSNETSGTAIMARQREGDTGNYLFTDNLLFAIEETGRIIVDAIPKVYDATRRVTVRNRQGETSMVTLNKPTAGRYENRLSSGYDVETITGPAFGTARQEAVQAMTALFQAAPNLAAIGADLWVANQDWPGADELASRLKKMVPPELLEEQGNDPQAQAQQMQAALQQAQQAMQQMQQQLMLAQQQLQEVAQQAQQSGAKVEELARQLDVAKAQAQLTKQGAQVEIDRAQALLEIAQAQGSEQPQPMDLSPILQAMEALRTQMTRPQETPPPIINVTIEKSGAVKKDIEIKAPSGQTYKGTVTQDEE